MRNVTRRVNGNFVRGTRGELKSTRLRADSGKSNTVLCDPSTGTTSEYKDTRDERSDKDGLWSSTYKDLTDTAKSSGLQSFLRDGKLLPGNDDVGVYLSPDGATVDVVNVVPNYNNLSWTQDCTKDLSNDSCKDNKFTDGRNYTGYYAGQNTDAGLDKGVNIGFGLDLFKAGDMSTTVNPCRFSSGNVHGLCGCIDVENEYSCQANKVLDKYGKMDPSNIVFQDNGPNLGICTYPSDAIRSEDSASKVLDYIKNKRIDERLGHILLQNYCFETIEPSGSISCGQTASGKKITKCPRISTSITCKKWAIDYPTVVDPFKEGYCMYNNNLAACDCLSAEVNDSTVENAVARSLFSLYNTAVKEADREPSYCWYKPCSSSSTYALKTNVNKGTNCSSTCNDIISNLQGAARTAIVNNVNFTQTCLIPTGPTGPTGDNTGPTGDNTGSTGHNTGPTGYTGPCNLPSGCRGPACTGPPGCTPLPRSTICNLPSRCTGTGCTGPPGCTVPTTPSKPSSNFIKDLIEKIKTLTKTHKIPFIVGCVVIVSVVVLIIVAMIPARQTSTIMAPQKLSMRKKSSKRRK